MNNNVNHPIHYTQGNIECIDAMIAAYGNKVVSDFCKCNVFKYTFRSQIKQPKESMEKAKWYLEKYMQLAPEFKEEWKIHPNGLYEVSSLGNIRRVNADHNEKIITLKTGYNAVMFSVNDEITCNYIHRLVAELFISNPNNYSGINHKNNIKTDNRVENLEWYNPQDNDIFCIYIYNTIGDFLGKYNSLRDCEKAFGIKYKTLMDCLDTCVPKGNLLFYTKILK